MRVAAYLAYPFPHSIDDRDLVEDPVIPECGWGHWFSRFDESDGDPDLVADHSYSFLPHVRRLLFPELVDRTSEEAKRILRTLQSDRVDSVRRAFAQTDAADPGRYLHACTRLTWTGAHIGPGQQLEVRVPGVGGQGEEHHRLDVRWTDALLFPERVGVLLMAVELPDVVTTEAAARVLRHVKKIEHRRRLSLEISPDFNGLGLTAGDAALSWAGIIDEVLAPLSRGPADPAITIGEVTGTLGFNWRMALVAHVDDLPAELVRPPFRTPGEQAAFALATGHMAPKTGTLNLPAAGYWEQLVESSGLAMWTDWQMLYHYDNLVQIVTSSDPHHVAHQFENFQHEYVTLFVLVTAQRYALDLLQASSAQIAGPMDISAHRADALESDLIRFSTRLWHSDVSTTPVGVPLYGVLCRALGLGPALDELKLDMQSVRLYLARVDSKRAARSAVRTQRLLEALTVVGVPTGLALTVLAPILVEQPALKGLTANDAWSLLGGIVALLTIVWLLSRKARKDPGDDF